MGMKKGINKISGCGFIRAHGANIRTSFKNMSETSKSIRGKKVSVARQILKEVLDHQRCIIFRRFTGSVGRTSQARNNSVLNGQGRWSVKSTKLFLKLLGNAGSN